MEHNITAVCEEQKRLEQERELLDTGDSGSDNDSGEVDQSIMDISDDGDNADKSASCGGLHLLATMLVTRLIRCTLQQTVIRVPVPSPIRWALAPLMMPPAPVLRWALWTSPVDQVVEVPTPKRWAPASPREQ